LFPRFERLPDLRVEQAGKIAVVAFTVILHAEEIVTNAPLIFESAFPETVQENFAPLEHR